ncbi:MAG TPA: hypothetical protein VHF06_20175 [Pseudonocardiaceae bacterium]|jgi:hypothetical protein|nr:hypothetical protein [Pseudonocardiaceae bacterium]
MSWEDFYRRRDAISSVLAFAQRTEGADLPFEELDDVPAVFADREELALALQYKWSQALQGRVAVALSDAERALDVDHVEAVAAAWRTTAAEQPALRRLLDGYRGGPAFREAVRAEQRMIAHAAGLAENDEPADEAARIGAAFIALVRGVPTQRTTRHRNPVEQLLRRLVAS